MTHEQMKTAFRLVTLLIREHGMDPAVAEDKVLAALPRLNAPEADVTSVALDILRSASRAGIYDAIRAEVQQRDAARRSTPTAAERLDAATPGANRIDAQTPTTAAERLRALGG